MVSLISIHALRRRATHYFKNKGVDKGFQSTLSARRATLWFLLHFPLLLLFQSTLSARRATGSEWKYGYLTIISIHALREESDRRLKPKLRFGSRFQSTLSARRATDKDLESMRTFIISIHALREESDHTLLPLIIIYSHFNPRSPRGERP